jgi:hypothetical protein
MRKEEMKIRFNKVQLTGLFITSFIFLCFFVAEAFFDVKMGLLPDACMLVVLAIFLYLAKEKKSN